MNRKKFDYVMHALDDQLLEEAQMPGRKKQSWIYVAAGMAACICILSVGWWMLKPEKGTQNQPGMTMEDLAAAGYDMVLPENVEAVTCELVELGAEYEAPMAQVTFVRDETEYTYRALKTEEQQDISGMDETWENSLDWNVGGLSMQMRQAAEMISWVGWYEPENRIQFCLSAKEESLSVLHTAQDIVQTLGYDMAVAPEGAEDILYNAFRLNDMTVGETTFTLDGIHYAYRTASTYEIAETVTDISGTDDDYEIQVVTELGWCRAEIYYTQDGAGKIIWFDVAPGLLYSLSMDTGASEEALLFMAQSLYTPAQGEVG